MKQKSQNINMWQFKDIFMVLFLILAFMLFYLGITQFFNFDLMGIYYLVISQVIFYIISSLAVFYITIFKRKNSLTQFFGFENFSKNWAVGFIGGGILVLAATLIDLLTEKFLGIKSSDVYQNFDSKILLAMSYIGIFFAPFAEEIFFRGFLQPVFVKKFGEVIGIICICILFALAHILYIENLAALLEIFTVGAILSIIKEKTGSLIPCIIAHFLNNLIAIWVIFFT